MSNTAMQPPEQNLNNSNDGEPAPPARFEEAANARETGLIGEFVQFLAENRAWWLIPILLALALLGALAFFAGSPLAPFIYPLF